MDKTGNFYGTQKKTSKPALSSRPPPSKNISNKPPPNPQKKTAIVSNKPPPPQVQQPKKKTKKSTAGIIVNTNLIIPANFERSKYSIDDYKSFFSRISKLKDIESITE